MLLLGCLLVTVLYVALNAVLLRLVPPAAGGRDGWRSPTWRRERALGLPAARLLSLVIAGVLAASVSALTMTGARVSLAMAEDGRFFRLFARRNARGAPAAGVVLQGGLALMLALTATFEALLVYVGFTLSLSAAGCVLAAMLLRRREPQAPRPYRTPGWPLVPLAYLGLTLDDHRVDRPAAARIRGRRADAGRWAGCFMRPGENQGRPSRWTLFLCQLAQRSLARPPQAG